MAKTFLTFDTDNEQINDKLREYFYLFIEIFV